MKSLKEVENKLSNFCGTKKYYKNFGGLVYTYGIKNWQNYKYNVMLLKGEY